MNTLKQRVWILEVDAWKLMLAADLFIKQNPSDGNVPDLKLAIARVNEAREQLKAPKQFK